MNESQQHYDPFEEFINTALDLGGIDGLDQTAVAVKMRHLLRDLPANISADLWNEQLDSLQAVIRICLDLDMVMSAFEERLETSGFNRDDLEILVMLSVTFSFVCYNHLRPIYNVDETYNSDDTLLARRLRDTLKVAMGWVKKAARDGDQVAFKFLEDTTSLIDTTKHLE